MFKTHFLGRTLTRNFRGMGKVLLYSLLVVGSGVSVGGILNHIFLDKASSLNPKPQAPTPKP